MRQENQKNAGPGLRPLFNSPSRPLAWNHPGHAEFHSIVPPKVEDGMQFLRSTLFVLALASPLAGCISITRHESDQGRPSYYDQSYCGGGPRCSSNPGTYYYP